MAVVRACVCVCVLAWWVCARASCSGVPQSPCPALFQYHFDGERWSGLVTTRGPGGGRPVRLELRMALAQLLTDKFAGRLELVSASRRDMERVLVEGGPLRYRVTFPVPYPLPVLTDLRLNGAAVCVGPVPAAAVLTTVSLEHTLYPAGRRLNPERSPSSSTSPPLDGQSGPAEPIEPRAQPTAALADDAAGVGPIADWQPLATDEPTVARLADAVVAAADDAECGIAGGVNALVVNGRPVERGQFPWLAALFQQRDLGPEFACGGSLVSRRAVLTAAHCVRPADGPQLPADRLLVALGKHRLQRWTERGAVLLDVQRVVLHPDYDAYRADADLAVVRLAEDAPSTPLVRPICMWPVARDLSAVEGRTGLVVGWGMDERRRPASPEPRATSVRVVSQERCLRSHRDFRYITSERTLCASGESGAGPCSGDSGGALMFQRAGRWHLRAVISMSLVDPDTRGCDLGHYVVYVDVAKFRNWIGRNAGV